MLLNINCRIILLGLVFLFFLPHWYATSDSYAKPDYEKYFFISDLVLKAKVESIEEIAGDSIKNPYVSNESVSNESKLQLISIISTDTPPKGTLSNQTRVVLPYNLSNIQLEYGGTKYSIEILAGEEYIFFLRKYGDIYYPTQPFFGILSKNKYKTLFSKEFEESMLELENLNKSLSELQLHIEADTNAVHWGDNIGLTLSLVNPTETSYKLNLNIKESSSVFFTNVSGIQVELVTDDGNTLYQHSPFLTASREARTKMVLNEKEEKKWKIYIPTEKYETILEQSINEEYGSRAKPEEYSGVLRFQWLFRTLHSNTVEVKVTKELEE